MSHETSVSTIFDNNFDNVDCKSASECISIKRVIKFLAFYNKYKDIVEKQHDILLQNLKQHKYIQDDFHHILRHHLSLLMGYGSGDFYYCDKRKRLQEINEEYWRINDMIRKTVQCDFNSCKAITRNYRDREQEPYYNKNPEMQIYIDIMDEIHNYFLHSFDCGMRIKLNEELETQSKEQIYDESLQCIVDNELKKIEKIIKPKQRRLQIRSNGFLSRSLKSNLIVYMDENDDIYYTDSMLLIYGFIRMNEMNDINFHIPKEIILIFIEYYELIRNVEDNKKRKSDEVNDNWYQYPSKYDAQYYIGEDLMYYDKNKKYVSKMYASLKEEMLNNKIHSLTLKQWMMVINKTNIKAQCANFKVLEGPQIRERHEICGAFGKQKPRIEHISSVILYCDYYLLAHELKKTLIYIKKDNKKIENMKTRNKEFAILCCLLKQVINAHCCLSFDNTDIKKLYGIIPQLIVIPSFIVNATNIMSTTSQFCVANMFINDSDNIIEFYEDEGQGRHLDYFDSSWISCYPNEDEKIIWSHAWCKTIRISAVRLIKEKLNYAIFIQSITSFWYEITGKQEGVYFNVNAPQIIKCLFQHFDIDNRFKNNYPDYINVLFNLLIQHTEAISVESDFMNKKILFHEKCDQLFQFPYVFRVFYNVQRICYEFDSHITIQYITLLSEQITEIKQLMARLNINESKAIKLRSITYDGVDMNQVFLKQLFSNHFKHRVSQYGEDWVQIQIKT